MGLTINIFFNLGLLFAILIAPGFLMASHWYRKGLGKARFIWPKPEMVMVTIVYCILSLIILIIGVSCMFAYFGYLDPTKFAAIHTVQFYYLGLACILWLAGLSTIYFALRRIMVQFVMSQGLVTSFGFIPFSNKVRFLNFRQIVDYYYTTDYPNLTFTFIVASNDFTFKRISVKVPFYIKEDFQNFLEKKLYNYAESKTGTSSISNSKYFSEN